MGQRTKSKKKQAKHSELDSLLSRLEGGEIVYLTRHGDFVGVIMGIEIYARARLHSTSLRRQNHLDFLEGRSDGIDIDALSIDQEKSDDQSE